MSPKDNEYLKKWKKKYPEWFKDVKVLELGSRNINGSVREEFKPKEYVGIDWVGGRGVDVVCYAHQTDFEKEYFDVLISYSAFEHDLYWKETISHNLQFLKKGGVMLFAWAGEGSVPHGIDYATDLKEFKDLPNKSGENRKLQEEYIKEGKHYFPKTIKQIKEVLTEQLGENLKILDTFTRKGGVGTYHYLTAIKL